MTEKDLLDNRCLILGYSAQVLESLQHQKAIFDIVQRINGIDFQSLSQLLEVHALHGPMD